MTLVPSSSALLPMSICTLQCLFSHSFTTYEWLNRDCDVQIYIGITSRWTGYWSVYRHPNRYEVLLGEKKRTFFPFFLAENLLHQKNLDNSNKLLSILLTNTVGLSSTNFCSNGNQILLIYKKFIHPPRYSTSLVSSISYLALLNPKSTHSE
jgi:hypothetical protein